MTFGWSNPSPMNDRNSDVHAGSGSTSTRLLWLKAQFFGCAVLLAACGGGDGQATDSTPTGPTSAPAPSPSTGSGSAKLSWAAPKTNADGTTLTDLAGYRIYYGTTSGSYSKSVTIADPWATTYTVDNLSASTYFFVIRAFDRGGIESAPTPEASKTIK